MVDYSLHELTLYNTGFQAYTPKGKAKASKHEISKRGTIKSFSYASRRRLKDFLVKNISVGCCYGITCTVPFFDYNEEVWLLLLKRFFMRVTRLDLPLVYRVELQQNGMPHLHCVSYYKKLDDSWAVQLAWWESLASITYDDSNYGLISLINRDGALLYSCTLSAPSSDFSRWYRYLCSHATKQKISQLGYKGRHWGICNRKLFFEDTVKSSYVLDDYQYYIFLRWIRKLCKCKTKRFLRGKTTQFCNPQTIERMVKYILETTKLPF